MSFRGVSNTHNSLQRQQNVVLFKCMKLSYFVKCRRRTGLLKFSMASINTLNIPNNVRVSFTV